jgi:SAM-dependent methyltransferase
MEQTLPTCAKFKEAEYLLANPDVARKVNVTPGYSGWRHFWEHGYQENRNGVGSEVYVFVQKRKDYQHQRIVAPPHLRERVHGSDDLAAFESIGRLVAANVFGRLLRVATDAADFRILDFGVGCGRVLRPLAELCNDTSLTSSPITWWGSDIDEEAIVWCRKFLSPIGEFAVNKPNPPLPFKNQFFDFVYSISIFTHLPEEMQFQWLAELRRVMKIGATALLSTHSFDLVPGLWKSDRVNGDFYYHLGQGTDGLPEFYQTSFHSHDYIRAKWSKYFEITAIIPRGVAKRQDLIWCKRIS